METVRRDSLQRVAALYPYAKGRRFYEVFPPYYMMDMPFGRYPYHHCILGGKHMSKASMSMDERIKPRGICTDCWKFLVSISNEFCFVCGGDIEELRLDHQDQHPLDFRYRIHGGKCANAFTVVVARALGYDTGFLEEFAVPRGPLPYPWVYKPEDGHHLTPLETMGYSLIDLPHVCCVSEPDVICVCDYGKGFGDMQRGHMAERAPIIVNECGVAQLPEPKRMLPDPGRFE